VQERTITERRLRLGILSRFAASSAGAGERRRALRLRRVTYWHECHPGRIAGQQSRLRGIFDKERRRRQLREFHHPFHAASFRGARQQLASRDHITKQRRQAQLYLSGGDRTGSPQCRTRESGGNGAIASRTRSQRR